MVEHRTTDDTAADHDNTGMGFHSRILGMGSAPGDRRKLGKLKPFPMPRQCVFRHRTRNKSEKAAGTASIRR
jgi:hypothetical protein